MIGNDVVDLHLAQKESNWKRIGFLEKVFTDSEQDSIRTAANPHLQVWLLWSMKEAAYKAHQRKFSLPRKLNWKDQECKIRQSRTTVANGLVRIGQETYSTASRFSSNLIHTVAACEPHKPIFSKYILGSPKDARKCLCSKIAHYWSLDPEHLNIQKEGNGIPTITLQEQRFLETFSLSGHGKYSGYAVCF